MSNKENVLIVIAKDFRNLQGQICPEEKIQFLIPTPSPTLFLLVSVELAASVRMISFYC